LACRLRRVTAEVFAGACQQRSTLDALQPVHAVGQYQLCARYLGARTRARARDATAEALRLIKADYSAGTVGYLQILIADSQSHQARILWLQDVGQRLQDTVTLYAALGGEWDGAQ
jgi:outer membrane protein TolC